MGNNRIFAVPTPDIMAIFYHGSCVLFETFDLSHFKEGDGKGKYGFGAYVTEKYASAAHYSFNKKRPEVETHYVYTFEVPDKTEFNYLPLFKRVPVPAHIVAAAERKLGVKFPPEATVEGIPFRKYLGNLLRGEQMTLRQMTNESSVEGEKAASAFLLGIGVELIVWPQGSWTKPKLLNMAVLDDSKMRLLRIDQVDLTPKKHELIPGSERLIKEFPR